MSVCPVETADL